MCVFCVLLLLPAFFWYYARFEVKQAVISSTEVGVILSYVVLSGWVLPLSVATIYCLSAVPRTPSITDARIPRQGRSRSLATHPPTSQPGMLAPFVFSEDDPWGWLEYHNGSFHGQRLALHRQIVVFGRGEESDIWIDDAMASRYHAELIWDQGKVYLTDCKSLNGTRLNNRRIRRISLIESNDLIEIGSFRFTFILAEQKAIPMDQDDPLANHQWRSSLDPISELLPLTQSQDDEIRSLAGLPQTSHLERRDHAMTDAVEVNHAPTRSQGVYSATLVIHNGKMAGQRFLLDRPSIIVGRGVENDIVIDDVSISRQHIQVVRQKDGDYVQDLARSNETLLNDEPLSRLQLLQTGDLIRIGNIYLEYAVIQIVQTTPLSPLMTPQRHSKTRSNPGNLLRPNRLQGQ